MQASSSSTSSQLESDITLPSSRGGGKRGRGGRGRRARGRGGRGKGPYNRKQSQSERTRADEALDIIETRKYRFRV